MRWSARDLDFLDAGCVRTSTFTFFVRTCIVRPSGARGVHLGALVCCQTVTVTEAAVESASYGHKRM
jgi:hypothetical protein